jgi:GNAT superfamily N-acetyltransferase
MAIEFNIYDTLEVSKDNWRDIQTVQREAFARTLDRSLSEIDELVGWDDPDRFYTSHADPMTEVGKRFNDDQSYTHPRVAVATSGKELLGFAYSAHNTSGSTDNERQKKRLSIVKNYLWLREIAVRPDHQQQGVAISLSRLLLKDAIRLQPVTAYVWPEEVDFLPGILGSLGFQETGEQQVILYGQDSDPVKQVRMQAKSAHSVLKKLR